MLECLEAARAAGGSKGRAQEQGSVMLKGLLHAELQAVSSLLRVEIRMIRDYGELWLVCCPIQRLSLPAKPSNGFC